MHHTTALISPTKRVKLVPPKGTMMSSIDSALHPLTRRYLRFLPTYYTIEDARIRRQSRAEDHQLSISTYM